MSVAHYAEPFQLRITFFQYDLLPLLFVLCFCSHIVIVPCCAGLAGTAAVVG